MFFLIEKKTCGSVSYKNNTHTMGTSIHYFPKDVPVWPKWTRFDRCHRRDFTLQSRRPFAPSRLRRRLLRTHTASLIRDLRFQRIQLIRMLIKGPIPTSDTIPPYFFRLTSRERRMVSLILLFISRAWDVLILLVFLHNYICSLIAWKSNQSYFDNRNTTFVIKFTPFPVLTDILLREQCETSGGYWHKLEGVVYSFNLGFRKSISRTINSPLHSRN